MRYTFILEKHVMYGKFPNYHHKWVEVLSDNNLKVHDFETAQATALKKVETYLSNRYPSDMWEVKISEWTQVTRCHFRADIVLNLLPNKHQQDTFVLHVTGYTKGKPRESQG